MTIIFAKAVTTNTTERARHLGIFVRRSFELLVFPADFVLIFSETAITCCVGWGAFVRYHGLSTNWIIQMKNQEPLPLGFALRTNSSLILERI